MIVSLEKKKRKQRKLSDWVLLQGFHFTSHLGILLSLFQFGPTHLFWL